MYLAKYSANGNDFVIFHTFVKEDRSALAKQLCNRHNGVGADGLIVLLPHDTYDFEWQFYNDDGSTAEMCGNGSRAAAHYAYTQGLAPSTMQFLTEAGVIGAEVNDRMVLSELTPPILENEKIHEFGQEWMLINTGVPHLVALQDSVNEFNIEQARELRYKYNANVNISAIDQDGNIQVRTYERGVENETQACGTGMAACYVRANMEKKVGDNAKVFPTSQETLYLAKTDKTITFKGEVTKTFETIVTL
jgi:diaminopimelate epimerase